MTPPKAASDSRSQILRTYDLCLCIKRAVTISLRMLSSLWLTQSLLSLLPTRPRPARPFFSTYFLQFCWPKKSRPKRIFKSCKPHSCLNSSPFLVLVILLDVWRLSHILAPTVAPLDHNIFVIFLSQRLPVVYLFCCSFFTRILGLMFFTVFVGTLNVNVTT